MTKVHHLFPLNVKKATALVAGLSRPGKMPGFSYNTPAEDCNRGSQLRKVAGSVCTHCYAMQNRYIWPNVQDALKRRQAAFSSEPYWVPAMSYLLNKKADSGKPGHDHFRWFDSGDLPNMQGLFKILSVVRSTPNTKHWLPTREKGLIIEMLAQGHKIPANLVIRISMDMLGATPKLPKALQGIPGIEMSTVDKVDREDSNTCPAPTQGNQCKDCRACWERSGIPTNYMQHGGAI